MSGHEDRPVMEFVEEAFAAYRSRVHAPGYVPPKYRVPVTPPRFRPKHNPRREMDAEEAFAWMDQADSYDRDRLQGQTLDAEAIEAVYVQNYRHRYSLRQQPFPAAKLAKCRLTCLQWHDVFQRVKEYTGPRKSWDDAGSALDPNLEPFGLMVHMAKKMETNRDKFGWRRKQAAAFLGKLGLQVAHMTMEQRREVKEQYLAELRHPRAYA